MNTEQTATIKEYDQFIGRYSVENAPNGFIRDLVREALENGSAIARDSEGCPVTAMADDD